MPRGPKGEKRAAEVIGAAVMVGRIAFGELEEGGLPPDDGKDPAAVSLGRKGGKARAVGMSAKRRKEIAKKAATSRWLGGAGSEYPLSLRHHQSNSHRKLSSPAGQRFLHPSARL
jgi:hypothetical protein